MMPEMSNRENCQQCIGRKFESILNKDMDELENLFILFHFLNSCEECSMDNFYEKAIRYLIYDIKQDIDYEEEQLGGLEHFSCGAIDRAFLKKIVLDVTNIVFEEDDHKSNIEIEKFAVEMESTINKIGECVHNRLTLD